MLVGGEGADSDGADSLQPVRALAPRRHPWMNTPPGSNCRLIHKSSYLLGRDQELIDRSAWHHADDWRLYGVSPVRSNTIRRTRPVVSAIERPSVKGTQPSVHTFPACTKRLKGYVRDELPGARAAPGTRPAGPR